MQSGVKKILCWMFNKKIIGGKHTPEARVLQMIHYLPKDEQKITLNEYEECIKQKQWIFRMKKTGARHVTLNPNMIDEIAREIE